MYIIIPAVTPAPYRQLRSLSFAPEVDLTLSSLPVNEFRAEIVTEDVIPAGVEAILMDDMDQLWADYTITKAERIDRQSFRIVAQSDLTLMDRWTLPAEMFQNVEVSRFIQWLFRIPKSGYLYNVDIDVDVYFNGVTVTGFCPEQTARERLQWLCVTVGAVVRQCFASALQFIPAPDVDATAYYAKGTLIPISETFMKPSVTIRELMRSVAVTGYENFTNVDPTPQPEAGMEPGTEPVQVIEWESSVDEQGVTWWYNPVDLTFENEESPELPGRHVSIDGVTLIGEASRQVIGWLSAAYFRQGEIRMDVINNAQYCPGQKVRVYAEEDTIYTGYIRSCDFRFGLQARATLVISSDLEQVPSGKLTISYRYGDLPLGRSEMVLPDGEPYDVENPTISWTEGGRYVEYTPTTPRATGTGDAVVQYVPRVPARIEIVTPPRRVTYADGMKLNYAGLVVRAYDNTGKPWTQGGLYPNGYILMRDLILPETEANMDKADGGLKTKEGLNISPSIPPVETGSYCCREINWEAHHYRPDYRYKSEYRILGGLLTTNVHRNEDGTFHGFFRYIMAADSPEATIEYTETRVNGEIAEHTTYHPRYSYKYKGKTVYYSSGGEAIAYDDNIYIGPVTDHISPMSSGDPAGPTAWVMIYGEITEGYESIPVRWQVPGTSQVFEDSFRILITPDPNAPASIEIVTPPRKLTYYDGETIDYTGLVVRVLDQEGNPSTFYGKYPASGLVPYADLVLPYHTANSGIERQSDLDISPASQPLNVGGRFWFRYNPNWGSGQAVGNICEVSGGAVAAILGKDADEYVCFHVIAASDKPGNTLKAYNWYGNGKTDEALSFPLDKMFAHNGKTVYCTRMIFRGYKVKYNQYSASSNYSGASVAIDENTPYLEMAWTMIYGSMEECVTYIPVRWNGRDGVLHEDSFQITVQPRF